MSHTGPDTVVITEGALKELETFLARYNSLLCVTDEFIYLGYKSLLEQFVSSKIEWLMTSEFSERTASLYKNIDLILGFGGGRSLDTAKLLAKETGLDWVSVPTAASHDGIASNVASVSHNGYKYSMRCKSPIAVYADLTIISKAPQDLRLAGTGDIVSKASSLAEWRLAHEEHNEPFDREVYSLVLSALKGVLDDDRLETLIKAEIDAGKAMSIFGSSRPCSGTEHAISHAMDRRNGNLHGIQVAFTTPLCLYYLEKANYAEYGSKEIKHFLKKRGIPITFDELSTTQVDFLDDVYHGLHIMDSRKRYSVLKHFNVDNNQLVEVLSVLEY